MTYGTAVHLLRSIVFKFVQLNVPGFATPFESKAFLNDRLFPPSLSVNIPSIVRDVKEGMKNSDGHPNLIVIIPEIPSLLIVKPSPPEGIVTVYFSVPHVISTFPPKYPAYNVPINIDDWLPSYSISNQFSSVGVGVEMSNSTAPSEALTSFFS